VEGCIAAVYQAGDALTRAARMAGPFLPRCCVSRRLIQLTKLRGCVPHTDVGNAASPQGAGAAFASLQNGLRRGRA